MTQQDEAGQQLNMFSGERQYQNFATLKSLLPSIEMRASSAPRAWPTGPAVALPESFVFEGKSAASSAYLERTDTGALLVIQDGQVRFEEYWLSGGVDVQWISWSVAKSFVSALVGIAIDEGHISDIDTPISNYITVADGSAYAGTPIRHVLQMSSGARWNEDYGDPESDINRFSAVMAGHGTFDSFMATLAPDKTPGTLCRYNSADTQALGALLIRATGEPLHQYMHSRLSEPLGFEAPGYWLIDPSGQEMAFGGLNLTARDFARLGELYRRNGNWHGQQLVPKTWIEASIRSDAAHLQPNRVEVGGLSFGIGYGYQWWIPQGDRGEFTGIGIYNQFVYVDPSRNLTIVKLSANPVYGSPQDDHKSELEALEFLRAIASACD